MKISAKNIPLLATAVVCVLLYTVASLRYENFSSLYVFQNFLTDNAFLGIASVGLTFVILSGGIDLSVGAVIGAVSITTAVLVEQRKLPPGVVLPVVLASGALFGTTMGLLIHYFKLPPFLVTLGGMFMARGIGFVISLESLSFTHPMFDWMSSNGIPLNDDVKLSMVAIIYLLVVLIGMYLAHFTPFGRTVYAIGGNENAALLMGLGVARTKVLVYSLSGFCSALAGIVYSFYNTSGNSSAGMGLELDAIAAVVIGGTLLSGGVGYVAGTFIGVLIFGIIQTAITFQGTLNNWWTKIVIAFLLLIFILLQKLITRTTSGGNTHSAH